MKSASLFAVLLLASPSRAASAAATPAQAKAFIDKAEAEVEELGHRDQRANWVQENFITDDTEKMTAEADQALAAAVARLADESKAYDGLALDPVVARKIKLLRLLVTAPAPPEPADQKELTEITASLQSTYGKGKYCKDGKCRTLQDLEDVMRESRDPKALLDAWTGWRTVSPPMRPRYQRFVELSNKGARRLGFSDTGALWRSNYDMTPEQFSAELDRLWDQVKPLYAALHAHVRAKLVEKYGEKEVGTDGLIPAHLLGNMWAQSWENVYDLVAPKSSDAGYDLTKILQDRKTTPIDMVKRGEAFFTSMGYAPLPQTFWERSLFTKPADREVVCHASAWDVSSSQDLRIKMCIKINSEDFTTIHHELGHNFYQRAYGNQPYLFKGSANDGFHEAAGDTIALAVTPEYLKKVGYLDKVPGPDSDLGLLLRMALERVAFLPFGLVVDQWRWKVFSGEVQPKDYNKVWWELIAKYQGIKPPVARSEKDFDPGSKYHVAANVPYTRYFLAHLLEFQFYRSFCRQAGQTSPLHRCTFYGNKEVGKRFESMMAMGQSQPWPDALEKATGSREMDATAVLDYFAPLKAWLDEQNKGRKVGF
ncbi:MAG TPA: M2 family metallopeptidase [Elusimicrobiota bacterium]|nr:M2 family metallopeptidase [Elusimicrobiota bacterium]